MSVLVSVLMAAATSSASSDCDRLAAHPEDPQRVTPGVTQDAIDYPVAIRICETAVAKEPENARLRYQLARLLFYTNQTQRAVEEMKRSADDNHMQAQYIYGTFVARARPFAPKDICIAERYWHKWPHEKTQHHGTHQGHPF
ncbi:MAG: tetratricopeptide repeat protein [Gammaproteobacteria bacterium]|nr:tetratricopeptide repeat protein [Gammaproteobacteria bacterium]